MPSVTVDGPSYEAEVGERLIDVINRCGKEIPQVCYHPQLGPIQTCDTCIVEVDGKLTRACGTAISSAITVLTKSRELSLLGNLTGWGCYSSETAPQTGEMQGIKVTA